MSENQERLLIDEKKYKLRAGIFLGTVASASALAGFARTVSVAKREEQKFLQSTGNKGAILLDGGTALAMRALAWGTVYAVVGTGALCFAVWKLSGAKDMQEFRQKIGSTLPRVTSTEPPRSRTDFEGLTDLMKYLSTWGKE